MNKPLNLVGAKFSMLRVLERAPSRTGRSMWVCECDCGTKKVVAGSELKRGSVRSCGCNMREFVALSNTKHGMSNTKAYRAWAAMLNRCKDPRNPNYGGRGLSVCKRWRAFKNFYVDMGDPPDGYSIDRIDNSKGYSKENCRWASPYEQTHNRRNSCLITFGGVTAPLAEHARNAGLRYDTVYYRIFRRGWSIDDALTKQPFGVRVEVSL